MSTFRRTSRDNELVVDLDEYRQIGDQLTSLNVGHVTELHPEQNLAVFAHLTDIAGNPVTNLDALITAIKLEADPAAAASKAPDKSSAGLATSTLELRASAYKPMIATHLIELRGLAYKPMFAVDPTIASEDDYTTFCEGLVKGGEGVHIGVVDFPVCQPGFFRSYDVTWDSEFEVGSEPVRALSGHAAFVVSQILAHAPQADIAIRGVLDPVTGRADAWDVVDAIWDLVHGHGAEIINLSLGVFTDDDEVPLILRNAINKLADEGVIVVAAAGNHGRLPGFLANRSKRFRAWPAGIEGVIAVGVQRHDHVTPEGLWVDCAGPATCFGRYLEGTVELLDESQDYANFKVVNPTEFSGWARWGGTSFAAGLVTGYIAALSEHGQPGTTDQVKTLLNDKDSPYKRPGVAGSRV